MTVLFSTVGMYTSSRHRHRADHAVHRAQGVCMANCMHCNYTAHLDVPTPTGGSAGEHEAVKFTKAAKRVSLVRSLHDNTVLFLLLLLLSSLLLSLLSSLLLLLLLLSLLLLLLLHVEQRLCAHGQYATHIHGVLHLVFWCVALGGVHLHAVLVPHEATNTHARTPRFRVVGWQRARGLGHP